MLIQTNRTAVSAAQDLIHVQNFHLQTEARGVKRHYFLADMNLFLHIDNKNKDISILAEGPKQGLDDTIITAEAKCNQLI